MMTIEPTITKTHKSIDFGDNSGNQYELATWREKPVEEWPLPLQMDFWLTVTIFGNLHFIPKKQVAKYLHIGEKVDADLMDLCEFA